MLLDLIKIMEITSSFMNAWLGSRPGPPIPRFQTPESLDSGFETGNK
jgi:hypothetical protein